MLLPAPWPGLLLQEAHEPGGWLWWCSTCILLQLTENFFFARGCFEKRGCWRSVSGRKAAAAALQEVK